MPETNYGALKATVPVDADKPIDIRKFFTDFTDSIGTGQGKGKLLIAQNTGAAAFKAMQGDATLAEDGTLTLANQGHFWSGAELTRASSSMGSFSTPIKVELPVIKPHQLLELTGFVYVLGGTTAPTLRLVIGAQAFATSSPGATPEYLPPPLARRGGGMRPG